MFLKARARITFGLATTLLTATMGMADGNPTAGFWPAGPAFLAFATTGNGNTSDKDKPEAAYKNPDYANPEKYTEKPLQIASGDITLPAILTLPKGKTSVPLVVLLHDAGAHDKDMTTGPNKPFRDIAIGLAAQGVATLRYDNRAQVSGELITKKPGFTVEDEVINDAVAVVNFGSKFPGIDTKKVYVLGHGFGGILAPRVAQALPNLNGIILMATPARPVHDYLLDLKEYEVSVANQPGASQVAALNKLRLQVGVVRSFSLSPATPADSLPLGLPASYWLDLREYNQGYAARTLPQRIMILHPERDYQVTLKDLEMWQQGLQHRGKQYTPVLYSDLNHLMQEGKDQSTPQEYQQPKNVPMYLMRNISTWVKYGL